MKLLFDENLSPKLPGILATQFPGSMHLRDCGLKGAADETIWEYARDHQFIIVSKDSDFYERSVLYGGPPKLIWLRIGNCTRDDLIALLLSHLSAIQLFAADPLGTCLEI